MLFSLELRLIILFLNIVKQKNFNSLNIYLLLRYFIYFPYTLSICISGDHVVITSTSNTIIGPVFSTMIRGDFTVDVTPWTFENNQVTSVADITFNSTECSGPASERFQVYGINGTANGVYLYVFGEGTAASGPACSNRYQLATP